LPGARLGDTLASVKPRSRADPGGELTRQAFVIVWVVRIAALGIAGAVSAEGVAPAAIGSVERAELAPRSEAWVTRLEAALDARALRGASISVLAVERATGREVFARNADLALVPASNQKLLTGVVALSVFGPSHRFTTRILSDARPDAEGQVERLYVVGAGDPTLTSEEWWRLAADLRRGGLRRVRSGLVLDDTAFDRELWNPSWGAVTARAYYAPVSALSANYGAFAIAVEPADQAGAPPRVALDPPLPYFQLSNQARTTPPGTPTRLTATRAAVATGEEVRVSGTVGRNRAPRILYRSTARPTLYAGGVLRAQLEAVGISVGGETQRGVAPEAATELLAFEGKSVAESVRLLMKYSNNHIAECLVKALGHAAAGGPGSWKTGTAALRSALQERGLDLGQAVVTDGSGLSRSNRAPARLFVQVLRYVDRSFDFGPELLAALPLAARDGTLEDRAEAVAGRMRAKTGRLDGVASLSGLVRTPARDLVFSVLVNGAQGGDADVVGAIDRFVEVLAQDPTEARSTREKAPMTRSAY